ncbi:MAG: diacylglycerol kinase family protein [Pseudomonadota bacterium]
MTEPFRLRARIESFRFAGRGLAILLREQHNCRIHFVATLVVIILGFTLNIASFEWVAVLFAVGLVWVAEALNSALEYLADAAVPEQHLLVAKAKDAAAAGVLVASIIAAAIGLLVFLPYTL